MNGLLTMDTVNFHIFGFPAYWVCAYVGFILTTCVYIMLMALKNYNLYQSLKLWFLSIVGMMFGAKIFGFLTGIYRSIGAGKPVTWETLADTGIVFYGGLFGMVITYAACLQAQKNRMDQAALNILAVNIPLFHSIARIGCFLSGCCYGKVYQGPFAVRYITLIENQPDVNDRFPVQLAEAVFEFSVFCVLSHLLNHPHWKEKKLLFWYFFFYSIGRFFLEFFRGDVRRGLICGISFSQCISVLIWIFLLGYYVSKAGDLYKKKEVCYADDHI